MGGRSGVRRLRVKGSSQRAERQMRNCHLRRGTLAVVSEGVRDSLGLGKVGLGRTEDENKKGGWARRKRENGRPLAQEERERKQKMVHAYTASLYFAGLQRRQNPHHPLFMYFSLFRLSFLIPGGWRRGLACLSSRD